MPTYVYRREDGTTFEVMQRITEDPLVVCPTTGQKVTRVIGAGAGLIFKGNGFYLTDYARKGEKGASSSDGASKESEPAPAKKDSKSAAEKTPE